MNLADALQHERTTGTRKGPGCTLCKLLNDLDAADSAALAAALADDDFTHAGIARALRESGHQIAAMTVSRHRRRECQQS
mgnify:CR=1 FL=1